MIDLDLDPQAQVLSWQRPVSVVSARLRPLYSWQPFDQKTFA